MAAQEIAPSTATHAAARGLVYSLALSQYSVRGGGGSACGLTSLNCARVLLGLEQSFTPHDGDILDKMLQQDTVSDILRPCALWSNEAHLDVDDIYGTPIFHRSLKLMRAYYGRTRVHDFRYVLTCLTQTTQAIGASASLVITRPPEIISCLKLLGMTSCPPDAFVIFDSHPRPAHPNSAAYIVIDTLDEAAVYLAHLLDYDEALLNDGDAQWQAQLLGQFSGYIYAARETPLTAKDLEDATLEASLDILKLQATVSELEDRIRTLSALNTHLDESLFRMREQFNDYLRGTRSRRQYGGDNTHSRIHAADPYPPEFIPSLPPALGIQSSSPDTSSIVAGNLEVISESLPRSELTNMEHHAGPSRLRSDRATASTNHAGMDMSALHSDARYAAETQRQYDREHFQLARVMRQLRLEDIGTFDCGICFEVFPEDVVARVEPCGHQFCRDCIRASAVAKIEERRYPIQCPSCAASSAGKGESGVVDEPLVQQLGLTETQYERFNEMQLAAFSVMVHCRQCRNTMLVDRGEYEATDIMTCPLLDCGYVWCKACSQPIDVGSPQHSCDGSSELQHLMKRQGWKYCPGCRTPAEKIEGCNHMSCMSPACNTHFCYRCGQAITRSARQDVIRQAVATHYTTCRLFDDVE